MTTGLLVICNIKNVTSSLSLVEKYVKKLYIYLNIPKSTDFFAPPLLSSVITKIYSDCIKTTPGIDVRILISQFKSSIQNSLNNDIQMLFSDVNHPEIFEIIRNRYKFTGQPIILNQNCETNLVNLTKPNDNSQVFDTVVLGGTFDRIHLGHKILLTEAVLRARKKLIVGVTNEEMNKSKKLPELILHVEQRIREVNIFLKEIDNSLEYDVVPINDPYGPTKSDPNIDMIIVSTETLKGGNKVNEIRRENGLRDLNIFCIKLIENNLNDDLAIKESKISSSNARMDLLGTIIKKVELRSKLPKLPYIIGLTGGIASGKSTAGKLLSDMGAIVFDCDKIAHEIYKPKSACYQQIINHFGNILTANNEIDRKKLGSIVFENPKELEILNNIVWPELLLEVKRKIDLVSKNPENEVVIIEAAVLFTAKWESECHEIWTMIIPPDEAVRRVMVRNNLSEEEARKRIKIQLDNKTLVEKSNRIFSSQWSYEFTQKQFEKAWTNVMKDVQKMRNKL